MKIIRNKGESKLIKYFLITFVFTWLFWLPDSLGKRGVLNNTIWTNLGFLGAFGPMVSALFLIYLDRGLEGIKKMFRKGMIYSFKKKWWIVIFFLFPLLIFIAFIGSITVDSFIPSSEAKGLYWFLPLIFFSVLFIGGPLTEEIGWRGYALPHLQAKYSPFISTLILGFIWSIWHLPQFIVPPEKTGMFYVTPIWSFVLTVIAANIIYTWVFNHTNGSILAVILLHTQMNLFFWIFPVLYTSTGYLWVLGIFILVGVLILVTERKYFFKTP